MVVRQRIASVTWWRDDDAVEGSGMQGGVNMMQGVEWGLMGLAIR